MTEYKKNLGIKESTSIVVSRIIGSGIFRTPAPIMALVGCTSLFGLVWVLGGIITIFGAVVYAELTAMIPKSGGPYVFLKEAYGPYVAFLRGWAMFFVSETASIVAVSLVFTEFINAIFQIITGTPYQTYDNISESHILQSIESYISRNNECSYISDTDRITSSDDEQSDSVNRKTIKYKTNID